MERVRTALALHGHPGGITELPSPAPTAAAAAEQLACPVGAIANSLIFEADGRPLLIVASGGHRVDLKKLGYRLHSALRSCLWGTSQGYRPGFPAQVGLNGPGL
jgi:prolyl-tRNA editing enzyme YbaK/EbsC (Cys-tRNA(Pro) deacylase)